MASNALVGNEHADAFVRWGVAPGPALWPAVLRILFVIDGRVNTSKDPGGFGLGYALETLRDPAFAWWVRFSVQVVRRDQKSPDSNFNDPYRNPQFQTNGFRFTEENFNFDDWDQVWFFGDFPSNEKKDIHDPKYHPLEDAELKLLAEWMDRGGGVFAAGDHFNLGASMCSRIPRVRTMRRWTQEQGVPLQYGDLQHQTLQPQSNSDELQEEGDAFPQPVELSYRPGLTSILTRPLYTHPLFATQTGVIDRFPDHMHEGEVIADDRVELDRPLDIPGYNRPEYPVVEPQADPGAIASGAIVDIRPRPRPHVVAHGRTTNLVPPQLSQVALFNAVSNPALFTKRFGLVGAYDGNSVGLGRVVVDSTWHHWFSYNLHGFLTDNPPVFWLMQNYYRNVGLWLAKLAQRQSMLVAATWGPVVTDPMAFPPSQSGSLWAVGQRAVEVISRTLSPSMLLDFVGSFFPGRTEELFAVPYNVNPADPYSGAVPVDLAVRAIVGGVADSLIQPASEYREAQGKPRPLLDPRAVASYGIAGVKQGQSALIDALRSSAEAANALVNRLGDAFRPPAQLPVPIDLVSLRLVAERLQFPDATDPALAEGHLAHVHGNRPRFVFTIRATLGDSVAATIVLREHEFPSFQPAGAFIELDRVLYEGPVQSGETLAIEVVAGDDGSDPVSAERLRFTETLGGDPASWLGLHTPGRGQVWRLWYRVERAADPAPNHPG